VHLNILVTSKRAAKQESELSVTNAVELEKANN